MMGLLLNLVMGTNNGFNFGFIFPLVVVLLPTAHLKTIFLGDEGAACSQVEIVPRAEWRARTPWRDFYMKMPANHVIIHHTVTGQCRTKPQCLRDVNLMQEYHREYLDWYDIAYNFLVGGDGRVYEGVGWNRTGAHSINFNTRSVGVAFVGDFRTVTPSQKMIDAALALIECGVQKDRAARAPNYSSAWYRGVSGGPWNPRAPSTACGARCVTSSSTTL